MKTRRAGYSEQLKSGNPEGTEERVSAHKHPPITALGEEANAHLLKSGEVRVGGPEVLCATSMPQVSSASPGFR